MAEAPRRPPDRAARREAARERRAAVTDLSVVLAAAGAILAARQVTVATMRLRLTRLGYAPTLVDAAIARLVAARYLDDRVFAEAWIGSRDRSRPRGTRVLRAELLRAGVPEPIVRAVLLARAEAPPEEAPSGTSPARGIGADRGGRSARAPGGADAAAAERLLARRAAALAREPDPRKRRARAWALLARNGFSPEICSRLAGGVGSGEGSVGGDPDATADAWETDAAAEPDAP